MEDLTIVIFGITGDLAQKKLIPALFRLYRDQKISRNLQIIGWSHKERSEEERKILIWESIKHKCKQAQEKELLNFYQRITFMAGDFAESENYQSLGSLLNKKGNRLYYLATHPNLYAAICQNLEETKLNKNKNGWLRLMIEKPIGWDLPSAREINRLLSKYYKEEQIFRIDHYLAKETIQNILTFRFHNRVVEALLNRKNIDHIQITLAESFGVGLRNVYYDQAGALRDVGQNHVLQMLAFLTMNRPKKFDNRNITKKRMEVFNNLKVEKESLVLGQYEGYGGNSENKGVDTFFAFKTALKRGNFRGVPIYVRGGKMLVKDVAEISVVFKRYEDGIPNVLIFRISPNEGIALKLRVRKSGMEVEDNIMQFCYRQNGEIMEAHDKLLLDAILGEQVYFNDAVEVEAQWRFIDKLKEDLKTPEKYLVASWGPKGASDLIKKDGREWLEPSEQLCHL